MIAPSLITGDRASRQWLLWATLVGIGVGVAYTLSPLTVWVLAAAIPLWRVLERGLDDRERQIVVALFALAVVLRLALLAGLFLSVDHWETPFGSLFGDEEYFKRRSMWLRSMALGVNVSEADRVYALDEYSETSYLYWLAFVQMLVGDAPYGVHVLSMLAYIAGTVWLFRFVRRAFGSAPALLATAGVLFWPTLFFWSVSALRESVHFFLVFAALAAGTDAITHTSRRHRALSAIVVVVSLLALRDLREGTSAIVLVALLGGIVAAMALTSWRRALVVTVSAALLAALALAQPAVQDRIMERLRTTGLRHQGHAFTGGVHYKLLEPRFYRERSLRVMNSLTGADGARYIVRAIVTTLVVPMPWQAETRLLQAYLPEHVLWLILLVLMPYGIVAGVRRHPVATMVLIGYVSLMIVAVGLYSGNVGTLVRHRGVVLPFVIAIGAVAVTDLIARATTRPLHSEV